MNIKYVCILFAKPMLKKNTSTKNNIYKKLQCNNCLKYGHILNICKYPIISYGIIVFRINNGVPEYLMINRRNSFGYIDFIKGNYNLSDIPQLQETIDNMSVFEKYKILNYQYCDLKKDLIYNINNNEEIFSKKDNRGIGEKKYKLTNKELLLENLIKKSNTNYQYTEWEFPKGRCEINENNLNCALREFQEETGYSNSSIEIIENVYPYDEMFLGSNYKSYKHKYFLAYMDINVQPIMKFQESEVSNIEWKTFENCIESIRPYSVEKLNIIKKINDTVINLCLSKIY